MAFVLLVLEAGLVYLEARETTSGGRERLLKFEAFLSKNFFKALEHIKKKL